jgi:peptidoglycan-associated lipoprotein
MRSKIFSYAIILTLIGTLSLTTGCAWWRKHFGPKPAQHPTETSVAPFGASGDITGASRPPDMSNAQRGLYAPVYFDFDSAKVRPSEVAKIEAVANAQKSTSNKIVVEGHCDERGTPEYNRALGERRAQAVREELVKLGISADRISTVSYGADRPADAGHDEAAWAKNRRCEFAIVSQ